jgi:hypothetical protein
MTFTRVGKDPGIKWEESETLEDVGISEEVFESIVEEVANQDISNNFEIKKLAYKREKAKEGLESGRGSFRRG